MKIDDLEKIDTKKMFKIYDIWPNIAEEAFEKKFEKVDLKNINHIIFTGMGGSGTIGDIFRDILSKENIHVNITKGYVLPNTVDKNTLIVVTSVSGNTSANTVTLVSSTRANGSSYTFTGAKCGHGYSSGDFDYLMASTTFSQAVNDGQQLDLTWTITIG